MPSDLTPFTFHHEMTYPAKPCEPFRDIATMRLVIPLASNSIFRIEKGGAAQLPFRPGDSLIQLITSIINFLKAASNDDVRPKARFAGR